MEKLFQSREGNDVGETKPVAASVQAETESESEPTRLKMNLKWNEKGEGLVKEGHYYLIRVRLASMNINWLSGEFSECTLDLRTEKTDSSKKKSSSKDEPSDSSFPSYQNDGSSFENNEPIIEVWKPITPDEIKRYAAYGREKVSFTTDAASGYSVSIYNAMQGKQCYDSFESVFSDYTIGRTYNIYLIPIMLSLWYISILSKKVHMEISH